MKTLRRSAERKAFEGGALRLADVARNYDGAASWYDPCTTVVFGWLLGTEKYRRVAVDRLGALEGATVLDIGCGTGRNFPLLVPRVGTRGRVIGLDYAEGMLAQARERVENNGWTNVQLIRGDAAKLEGVPQPVDAVISVWCLGIVYDLEAALQRAIEVLRPGGRIAIMDFGRSHPDRGPLRWLYPLYSVALDRSGIDSSEDLDDARLRDRWDRGRRLLRTGLVNFREETHLQNTGIILTGDKPAAAEPERSGVGPA